MHTDYTQYTNICNNDQVRPHNACSICLDNNASYYDLLDNATLMKFSHIKIFIYSLPL